MENNVELYTCYSLNLRNYLYRNGIREGVRQMEKLYNIPFNSPNIIKSCKTHKPYKGFNFRYAEIN